MLSSSQGPLDDISYEFKFLNGPEEDKYTHHLSADEFTIFEQCGFFVVMESLLLLFGYKITKDLARIRKLHHTVIILMVSVFCTWLGLVLRTVYYSEFTTTGIRTIPYETASQAFHGFGDQLLILQLVLLAKGWTIVRHKISAMGRMKIGVYMAVYCVLYWAAIIWAQSANPAKVVYFWQSPPGYLVVSLRLFAFLWFVYAGWTTHRMFHAKRGFYRKFLLFGGLWILTLPVFVAISTAIADYYRAKFMAGKLVSRGRA